jgi:surface protein
MKYINTYIVEKLKISKTPKHTLFPKDKYELSEMIEDEIKQNGKECSLNHIDVSKITDMEELFYHSNFNGDISEWNVSNVENMSYMFGSSKFNQDIYNWDVSNVINMNGMFSYSEFSGDISDWDVSNVENMKSMFAKNTNFNQDLSKWKINPNCNTYRMFASCYIEDKYKPQGIE